ncbi:MAG: hypothetical protein J6O61_06090 [Butyrivibrio sp.]|uniref:hypothetical protein n=1 Tax=Butyrivibrio sp. TaxID=28121 RepID=UPI001B2E95C7|nr:hypothetical protein [Butyrivibrio sp.]MBO6240398.1 hypothetical protein [Butyrivibrio sp.]
MDQKGSSNTSLFLMELIIAIFFFSLCAAVCVRLFFESHKVAEQTVNLNNAVLWSESLAEAFTGTNGDVNELGKLYPTAVISDNSLIIFFDQNWDCLTGDAETASYEAILNIKEMSAGDVYSDVTKYNTALKGNAITCSINIVDVRNHNTALLEVSDDDSNIIHSISVDTYRGK